MATLKAFISIKPRGYQSVRAGKYGFHQPKWTREYKKTIIYSIKNGGFTGTLIGPLRVKRLVYTYPIIEKKLWGMYKPTKPDLGDNANKLLFDALTEGKIIQDDRLIVEFCLLRKLYGEHGSIELEIEEIRNYLFQQEIAP